MSIESPIIILYLNLDGLSSQRAHQVVEHYQNTIEKAFNGFLVLVVPVKTQETKFEVIWKGYEIEKSNMQVSNFDLVEKKLNIIIELISNGTSDEIIKKKLRDISLNYILN